MKIRAAIGDYIDIQKNCYNLGKERDIYHRKLTPKHMTNGLIAKQSVTIDAPISAVWDALINPKMIKQYLFGTETVSDWKEGGSIIFKGEWEGKKYEDKGQIIKCKPEKLLQYTHWSNLSGKADRPENYNTVTIELSHENGQTHLALTQDNNADEEARKHSEGIWNAVLGNLKALVEKKI
ncbi:MAG: hypothetical protein QOG91_466 [Candidatus Parcubacteria bacterium]|jgi:uncharacterized protein YndB with AHSA1/START domain|nr:hypothetical protein [Candidatus Parcubacteria bacterium]